MEGTHAGTVLEERQLVGRTQVEEVNEGEGPQAGAGED